MDLNTFKNLCTDFNENATKLIGVRYVSDDELKTIIESIIYDIDQVLENRCDIEIDSVNTLRLYEEVCWIFNGISNDIKFINGTREQITDEMNQYPSSAHKLKILINDFTTYRSSFASKIHEACLLTDRVKRLQTRKK